MEKEKNLVFTAKPALRHPYVFCGVTGWVNGGEVSTGGVNYLIKQFQAKKLAEMPVSPYHVYQVPGADSLRPLFKMEEGLIGESHLPQNDFFYAANPASDHDLIFFLGNEPSINWEEYAATVVDLAQQFQASRLYTFGGVLDRTPHTREPRVSCSCTAAEVREEMRKYNVSFSNYEGPATFNTMLLYTCGTRGLEAVSLSVRATYYPEFDIIIPYNARAIKAVLVRLNHLTKLNLSFTELDGSIKEFEEKLAAMRQKSSHLNSYIEELEKNYIEMPYQEPLELSGDEGVKLAEEFLRKGKGQHQG